MSKSKETLHSTTYGTCCTYGELATIVLEVPGFSVSRTMIGNTPYVPQAGAPRENGVAEGGA